MGGWELGISTADGSNKGCGFRGDRGLYPKEAEHGCAIYCDTTNSGPLREVGEEGGGLVFFGMVGTEVT